MTGAKCVVEFCKNVRGEKKEVDFYRLTGKRYLPWLRAIGRNFNGDLSVEKSEICSDHFTTDSFVYVDNKKVLKKTALPTINLTPPKPSFQTMFELGVYKSSQPKMYPPAQPSTSLSELPKRVYGPSRLKTYLLTQPSTSLSEIPKRTSQQSRKDPVIQPPTSCGLSEVTQRIPVDTSQLQLVVLNNNLPSDSPKSGFLIRYVPNSHVTNVPYSRNITFMKNEHKFVDEHNSNTNFNENHNNPTIKVALCKKKKNIRRRSVRKFHNYYICPRKEKNQLDIREERKNIRRGLIEATLSVKTLANDMKRLTERIDDLTDIVKLYKSTQSLQAT